MSVLNIKNQETGEWESLAVIQGPKGERGEQGPKGPQGDPDVHIGKEEPTNLDTTIWIDTNESESTNYVNAPAIATVGQTIVVKEVDETGKPVAWECTDLAGGSVSAPAPLPLLADVTSEEALTFFEVKLPQRAVSRIIMQINVPTTEAVGAACYGRLNGKLWDGFIFGSGALAAGASKWLSLDLMEGGLARFMVSNSTSGLWSQSTINTCGKLLNIEHVYAIGIALNKADTTIPAGTRIQVWGE